MATVRITIDTDNAAFEDEPGREVGRILRLMAVQFEDDDSVSNPHDVNGNVVGTVRWDDLGEG